MGRQSHREPSSSCPDLHEHLLCMFMEIEMEMSVFFCSVLISLISPEKKKVGLEAHPQQYFLTFFTTLSCSNSSLLLEVMQG